MGMTHIRLAKATEDVLTGALLTAWKPDRKEHKDEDEKEAYFTAALAMNHPSPPLRA